MHRMFISLSLAFAAFFLVATAAPVPDTPQSLLADLAGPDAAAQSRARQLLPRAGADIAPALCTLLSHPEEHVWRAASNCIADLAHAVSVPGREREHKAVADALLALITADAELALQERVLRLVPVVLPVKHDLKPVASLLESADTQERARVALRELSNESAVRVLAAHLGKADETFRIALVDALGAIGSDAALHALKPLVRHRDPATQAAALRGLASSGDPSLASAMRAAREKATPETLRHVEDAWLRWLEAAGLKGGNVERVMELYEELLTTSTDEVIQGGALSGLGRFGDDRAAAKLTALLTAETPLSAQALYGLRMQQGRAAEVILRDAYPNIFPAYRAGYVTQLAHRESVLFFDTYRLAAADPDTSVKRAAIHGLVLSKSPEAIAPLKEVAADPALRAEASTSIANLARQLAIQGNREGAGRAWLAAHELSDTDEQRAEAIEGIKANPVPEAATMLAELLDDAALAALPIGTLSEITRMISDAGLADRAAALNAAIHAKLGEPGAVDQIIAHAERTGQSEAWRDKLGFIRKWQVVGPFPFIMSKGFEDHVGAPNVELTAEYAVSDEVGAVPLRWQPAEAGTLFAHISLMGMLGEPEHACAYAHATIVVPVETEAVLGLGSDDGIRAWLNGELVHENNIDRGVATDSDKVPVTLKPGVNTLLLQISQNGGGWGFIARLANADGTPLSFTQEVPAAAPAEELAAVAEVATTPAS